MIFDIIIRRKITLKPRTDQVPVVANRVRFLTLSGLVSDCCSTPNEQFFSYIMARKNNIMMSAFDERIYIGLSCCPILFSTFLNKIRLN